MVDLTPKLPNFYVRDPRTAPQQASAFYNDYYGRPVTTGQVYNPTAFNAANAPIGVAGVAKPSGAVDNILPALAGVAVSTATLASVPGVSLVDRGLSLATPIAAATRAVGDALDSSLNRLANNNLPPGADFANYALSQTSGQSLARTTGTEDTRVIITDPSRKFVNSSPITAPLADTNGVLFPYTPQITFGHKANYDNEALIHTNYEQLYYKNSTVDAIGISAPFTANTPEEALYVMAVIHFFRSVTKMFYGQDSLAGTPPPILFLDGYGNYILDHLPVLVTSFDTQYPPDVDYISISGDQLGAPGNNALIPSALTINVQLKPTYSRNRISNSFGLEKFVQGALITGGRPGAGGPGGFI